MHYAAASKCCVKSRPVRHVTGNRFITQQCCVKKSALKIGVENRLVTSPLNPGRILVDIIGRLNFLWPGERIEGRKLSKSVGIDLQKSQAFYRLFYISANTINLLVYRSDLPSTIS